MTEIQDATQIREKVTGYIKKNTLTNINKLNEKTLLFSEGIFDSMAFVLLIDFIEETFTLKPGDEDLVEENFESIDAITNYILRKQEVGVIQ
jgi:acyl carrier protein